MAKQPKQSAFQEWNSKNGNFHKNSIEYQERKRGFNAAIEAVVDLRVLPSHAHTDTVKELKEV